MKTESWVQEVKNPRNVLSLGGVLVESSSLCDFSSRLVSVQVMEQWLEHKLLLGRGDKETTCTGRRGRMEFVKGDSTEEINP